MSVRLSYLDLLGYTAMEKEDYSGFHNTFDNDFVPFFVSANNIFDSVCSHEIYQNTENVDAFYLLSSFDKNEDIAVFISLCRLLSLRQLLSIVEYRFTLRGFATVNNKNYLNQTFNPSKVSQKLYLKLDKLQKQTRFARVALDKKIASKQTLAVCKSKYFVCNVHSKAKTFYVNPFLIFFDPYFDNFQYSNKFVRYKFYETLRDSVSYLLNKNHKTSIDNQEPFKKAIWLALQFDYFLRKTNLPYKPILLKKDLKYAFLYLKNDNVILDLISFLKEIITIIKTNFSTEVACLKYLKEKYGKEFTLKRLKTIIDADTLCVLPLNVFEIGCAFIREVQLKEEIVEETINNLYMRLNRLYLSLLSTLKKQHEVFYGSLLEEYRNEFIVGNKMFKKTSVFDLFE